MHTKVSFYAYMEYANLTLCTQKEKKIITIFKTVVPLPPFHSLRASVRISRTDML